MAYLAISLWVIRDVAVRAAHLAEVPAADLVGTQRHYGGAIVTLVAAVGALVGAVLLMRSVAKPRPEVDSLRAPQIGAVAAGRRRYVRAGRSGTPLTRVETRPIRTTRVGDRWCCAGGYPSMKINRAYRKDTRRV